jgi:hypothetical protein
MWLASQPPPLFHERTTCAALFHIGIFFVCMLSGEGFNTSLVGKMNSGSHHRIVNSSEI